MSTHHARLPGGATPPQRGHADLTAAPEWEASLLEVMAQARELLDEDVAAAAQAPGGLRLAAMVDRVERDGLAGRSRTELVEILAAARRVASWAESLTASTAGALAAEALLFDAPQPPNPRAAEKLRASDPAQESRRRHQPGALPRRRLDATGEEISMRIGVSSVEARKLVRVGSLTSRILSQTGETLRRGHIDLRKASALAETVADSPGPVAWAVEQELLPHMPGMTATQIRREAQRRLIEVDPLDAEHRHAQARAKRHVTRTRMSGDGMAALTVHLPAEDCALVDQTLSAVAQAARSGGDARTTDQLRADALVALSRAGIAAGTTDPQAWAEPDLSDSREGGNAENAPSAPSAHGDPAAPAVDVAVIAPALAEQLRAGPLESFRITRPEIRIEIPWSLIADTVGGSRPLAGLLGEPLVDSPPGADPAGADPPRSPGSGVTPEQEQPESASGSENGSAASLAGYGALSDDVARAALTAALSGAGVLRRMITERGTRTPLDLGRSTYRPSKALAELIRARFTTCARPGCHVPAGDCEVDHIQPWHHGGSTGVTNLQPLCSRCHALKSAGALDARPADRADAPIGAVEWTTASGHTYARSADGRTTLVGIERAPVDAAGAAEAPPPY